MKRGVAGLSAAVLAFASLAAAQTTGRDPAQEAELDRTLQAIAPDALAPFHAGNDAMDRGDYAAAEASYTKMHEAAPSFVAGTRRLCEAEARASHAAAGVGHCREALAAETSAENHAALAAALVKLRPPTPAQLDEALVEAGRAVDIKPKAEFAQLTLCEVAYTAHDLAALDRCSTTLAQIDPAGATTHYFTAVDRLAHNEFSGARSELDTAKGKGLDPKLAGPLLAQIEAAERLAAPGLPRRILDVTQAVLAGWGVGLVVLFGVGWLLGAFVERGRAGAMVRRAYAGLVTLTTLYFYVSLAILVLAPTAAVVAFSYGAYGFGTKTFVQALVVCSVIVYAASALARAMTTYDDDEPLGAVVDLAKEDKLRELLEEVAKTVGTRPVDAVYAIDGASVDIVDRDGALAHLRGRDRALVLGLDAINHATLRSLRERLAREYGRWRRSGAASGSLALAMQRALDLGIEDHPSGLSPVRLLLQAWRSIYVRVTRGAIAEQERLAEAWANKAYGPEAAASEDDGDAAWSLFSDRAALEKLVRTGGPVVKVKLGQRPEGAKPKKAKPSEKKVDVES